MHSTFLGLFLLVGYEIWKYQIVMSVCLSVFFFFFHLTDTFGFSNTMYMLASIFHYIKKSSLKVISKFKKKLYIYLLWNSQHTSSFMKNQFLIINYKQTYVHVKKSTGKRKEKKIKLIAERKITLRKFYTCRTNLYWWLLPNLVLEHKLHFLHNLL